MSRSKHSAASGRDLTAGTHCQRCALNRFCLPAMLDAAEIADLEGIINRNLVLQKNEHLFLAGEPAKNLFALRSGALKTYLLDREGNEQITGFVLPGELVAIDAFGRARYPGYAQALETSLACVIPIVELEELAGSIANLRKQLLNILSGELRDEHQPWRHGHDSAEQRLAAFLQSLSIRFQRRGLSACRFNLPMSRAEIGNFLGLTTETISRTFSRLRRQGMIACRGREISIQRFEVLCSLGGHDADCPGDFAAGSRILG